MKKKETQGERLKRMKAIYARLFYQEMLLREEWGEDEAPGEKKDPSVSGCDGTLG
jgi:hypothetical protein